MREKELPEGWEEVELGEIIKVSSGDGLTSKAMVEGSQFPVFGGNGINGYHDRNNINEQTIVIGRVGYYCGVVHLTPEKAWVTDNALKVTFVKSLIDTKFLFRLLTATDLRKNNSSTAQPVISGSKIYPTKVWLPPLAEQKRIVAKLDEVFQHADTLKAKLARIPELLKTFRQAVLTQAVTGKLTEEWREQNEVDFNTWQPCKIGELIISIEAGKNFSCPSIPVQHDTVGLVKISAVTWGKFDPSETKTIDNPALVIPKLFINTGDFLFSRANTLELVGASVIVDEMEYQIMLSDKIWRVHFKEEPTKHFMNLFLKSKLGREEIESRASGNQLSMRNISQEKFKNIGLSLPTLEEQKEIVKKVEALFAAADAIEARFQRLKSQIDQLPQALLAKAFRGELVPQDPQDEPASVLLEKIKASKARTAKAPKGQNTKQGKQTEMVL